MSTIKISGTGAWDGDYEFDFARRRTARELWHFKQIAKVGWDEIESTIHEGSGPLVVAGLAVLTLVRAGKVPKEQAVYVGEQMLDLEEGEIILIIDAEEDEAAVPPTEAASDAASSKSDGKPSLEPSSESSSTESPETTRTDS